MIKLIGFQTKEGSFTNKESGEVIEYNNIEMHCVTDEKKDITGLMTIQLKAKADELQLVGVKEIKEALNKEIYPILDLTGKTDENGKIRNLVSKIIVVG